MKYFGYITILALLFALLFTNSAYAHGSGNTSDLDGNANGVIAYYTTYDFGPSFDSGMNRLINLHELYGAPDWNRVLDSDRAEIIIRRTPDDRQIGNGCDNYMLFQTGADVIGLDARDCPGFKLPIMHEGMHAIGGQHHDCTDYWLDQTVMVTCAIRLDGWGDHDRQYAIDTF